MKTSTSGSTAGTSSARGDSQSGGNTSSSQRPTAEHRQPGLDLADAWHAAAKTWESLGWPHRAGCAWWRHAEALLDAGQLATAATAALRAAAAAADGHAPLTARIRALA